MFTPKLYIPVVGLRIYAFHFFGVLGFIVGTLFGALLSYLTGLSVGIVLLMSFIAACVFFVLAFIPKIITGKETIVYYHHEIAILLVCSAVLRLLHLQVLPYLDIVLIGVGTFLAFGRLGCFSVGCCHGKPCTKGIKYGDEHRLKGFAYYYKNVSLLPVQLIESAFVFFILITGYFVIMNFQPGTFLLLYTVIYGTFRYCIEFYRGDIERPYWKGLSEAQWTTLILIIFSLILALAGKIPFYYWHVVFAAGLIASTCVLVLLHNKKQHLFSARHIAEIARFLHTSSEGEHQPKIQQMEANVKLYKTQQGLVFSRGQIKTGSNTIDHYTLSIDDEHTLSQKTINKLANLINSLQNHTSEKEIVKREGGIFQITFTQKREVSSDQYFYL